jgi:ABC-type branched-subunit amino acid transport system substrate-binding protein
MNQMRRRLLATIGLSGAALFLPRAARAAKKYSPGASDTEIKIGNTCPYSGPIASVGTIGKCEAAFFRMINAGGGINGRKIAFISYDDGYSPPKTVEQTRKLVESDHVLLIFSGLGTPTQSAVHKYLNQMKIPQLFVSSGATKWGDPKRFPWTIGFLPNYQSESRIYARYILQHYPNAKIGVLYQNDDYGRDYLKGLRDGLGPKAGSMIVMEAPYEVTDPTVDSQIVTLKASGADVLFSITAPKFTAQAIRKAAEIGWKPVRFLNSPSVSVALTLKPTGLANAKGIISTFWLKDPTDPTWKDDAGYKEWLAFMNKWYPHGDKSELYNVYAYTAAQVLVQVLKQCGDDLTRENVMRQAANIHHLALPMLLPGITVNTGPTDFYPIEQMRMARFNGERWVLFGPVMAAEIRA